MAESIFRVWSTDGMPSWRATVGIDARNADELRPILLSVSAARAPWSI